MDDITASLKGPWMTMAKPALQNSDFQRVAGSRQHFVRVTQPRVNIFLKSNSLFGSESIPEIRAEWIWNLPLADPRSQCELDVHSPPVSRSVVSGAGRNPTGYSGRAMHDTGRSLLRIDFVFSFGAACGVVSAGR